MKLGELIKKLQEIEANGGEDLVCCTYDSVLEDYFTLCFFIKNVQVSVIFYDFKAKIFSIIF